MPTESKLEGENGCSRKQSHLSPGTVWTDQDDPTSVRQRNLQAALTVVLDGLGIHLLMKQHKLSWKITHEIRGHSQDLLRLYFHPQNMMRAQLTTVSLQQ